MATNIVASAPIPAVANRMVFRTSGGNIYAILINQSTGAVQAWKSSNGGTSFTAQNTGSQPTAATFTGWAAAIDSTGVIHVIYQDSASATITRYITFNTSTDTWGTQATAATITGQTGFNGMAIAVDANDIPHIAISVSISASFSFQYTNRIGGSWKTPVVLNTTNHAFADIIIDENAIPIIVSNNLGTLRVYNGDTLNATSFTNNSLGSIAGSNTFVSLVQDSSNNTYVTHIATAGNVSTIKHNAGDSWATWGSQQTSPVTTAFRPNGVAVGKSVHVLYQSGSVGSNLLRNEYTGTGWVEQTTVLSSSTAKGMKARYANRNNPSPHLIDYIYDDGTNFIWDVITVAEAGNSNTYYFDASNVAVSDPNSVWTTDANAFDGSTGTSATGLGEGSTSTNYLSAGGTTAPSSGGTIVGVRARVYGKMAVNSVAGQYPLHAVIQTSGGGETLGDIVQSSASAGWTTYSTLTPPTGGWSWSALQTLRTILYFATAVNTPDTDGSVSRVEIEVTSQAATSYTLSTDYFATTFTGVTPSYTRTHTTDSLKRKATTVAHTTDALKRSQTTKSHTTGSLLRKQFTKTHTSDALLRKQFTKTHTTDANKKKSGLTVSHTTSANKKVANNTRIHTTDALKRQQFTKTHTTDAFKRTQVTRTHTTDALKRQQLTRTHTTDSLKRKQFTKIHTTDSNKRKQSVVTHTTDSNKRKATTVTHTTDAYLIGLKRYWVGGSGTWSDTAHWSLFSGGAGGASVPNSDNHAIFDANSFSSNGSTVNATADTIDVASFDASAVDQTFTLSGNDYYMTVHGNVYFSSLMSISGLGLWTIAETATNIDVDTKGKAFSYHIRIDSNAAGATTTLLSNITQYATGVDRYMWHRNTDLYLNGYTADVNNWYGSNNDKLDMGTTGTIKINDSYADVSSTLASGGSITNPGTWIYAGADRSGFNLSGYFQANTAGGTPINIGNLVISANTDGPVYIYGVIVADSMTFSPDVAVQWESGKTHTATTWNFNGTSGHNVVFTTNYAPTPYYFSAPSGTITGNYLTIAGNTATGGATWVRGTGFVDNGYVAGWRQTLTASHTTSANKRKANLTLSHTADAFKHTLGVKTHTTDSYTHPGTATFTKTHTTDSLKRKTNTLSHTTSANKRKANLTVIHTTDANKKRAGVTVSHTTNSLLRKQSTKTHTTDANKRVAGNTRTHTTDSFKRTQNTRTHTTDALKRLRVSLTHTTGSLLRKQFTKTHTTDAFKRTQNTRTHTTDANKKKATTRTHTTDSLKRKQSVLTHTTSSNKRKSNTVSHTTDAKIVTTYRYWVGGSGDWDDTAHWSYTSGGSGGAPVPTTSNEVVIDSNSGTASGTYTISAYDPAGIVSHYINAKSVDATSANSTWGFVTNYLTFVTVHGSFKLGSSANISGARITLSAQDAGSYDFDAGNGSSFSDITIDGNSGATWTLQGNLNQAIRYDYSTGDPVDTLFWIKNGTLVQNGYPLYVCDFKIDDYATLDMTHASIVPNNRFVDIAANAVINNSGNLILNLGTAVSPYFAYAYYEAHGIDRTWDSVEITPYVDLYINDGMTVPSSSFTLYGGQTIYIKAGETITADTFGFATGTSPIVRSQTTNSQYYFVSTASVDTYSGADMYNGPLDIADSNVTNTMGYRWYKSNDFVDSGNNTGWWGQWETVHSTDASLKTIGIKTHTADALKRFAGFTRTHTTNALLRRRVTVSHTTDARPYVRQFDDFSDNFNDGTLDTSKWQGTYSESGGNANFVDDGITNTFIKTAQTRSIIGNSFFFKYGAFVGTFMSQLFYLQGSGGSGHIIRVDHGEDNVMRVFNSAMTTLASWSYVTGYDWIRFRESGGTFYIDTAMAPGNGWTNRYSGTTLSGLNNAYFVAEAGWTGAAGGGGKGGTFGYIDNYNVSATYYTPSHTTDALKRKQSTISHTTSANKRKADLTVSHTTSANKKLSGSTRTHTTDSLLRRRITVSHTADANKRKSGFTLTHTTSANKRVSGFTKTHTTDANKKLAITRTHTTDSMKRGRYTVSFTTDANKKKTGFTKTHTTDTMKHTLGTKTHTTDTAVRDSKYYTKETNASLPTDSSVRSLGYLMTEMGTVASDNSTYIDVTGIPYLIFNFDYYNQNSSDQVAFTWNGKSTIAPALRPVYLQIWNKTSASWETLDSNSSTSANTDFTLSGSKTTNLTNYYDTGNRVVFRVYQ